MLRIGAIIMLGCFLVSCEDHVKGLARVSVEFAYKCQREGKTEQKCLEALDKQMEGY